MIFIITVIGTPTKINGYGNGYRREREKSNLFNRLFSRERQLLLSSARARLTDEFGMGPVRTFSRVSSGMRVLGRQAPEDDDDSPGRCCCCCCCCDGRSFSLRGLMNKASIQRKKDFYSYGLERFFSTVCQLSVLSKFPSVRRSDDVGESNGRLSSRWLCSFLPFPFHGSSTRRSPPFGLQENDPSTQLF